MDDFIKKEFLSKTRWRWTNKLLKLGSQWMLDRFGGRGRNAIANTSLVAFFAWIAFGAVGVFVAVGMMISRGDVVPLVIVYSVYFLGIAGILGIFLMSVNNAPE